jgi:hypothetical protein
VQTVRKWENAGLPFLKDLGPFLILGRDLKGFLEAGCKRKEPLGPNRFFCTRCRGAVEAAGGLADLVPHKTEHGGRLEPLCAQCEVTVNRFVSAPRLPSVASKLDVAIRGRGSSLSASFSTRSKARG